MVDFIAHETTKFYPLTKLGSCFNVNIVKAGANPDNYS